MDIQVEQSCPQCGAPVTLTENDRLLICPYCGIKNFLQTSGPFRYILPDKLDEPDRSHLIYAPYIRLKSNVFHVLEDTIAYNIIDTTQLGFIMPGLKPTLGMRPQAMKINRLTPKTRGRFLRLSVKAKDIIHKATRLNRISRHKNATVYHRAYIGDNLSFIYLPVNRDETHLIDSVTESPLIELDKITSYPLKGTSFNPRWQVRFLPSLCPHCGWNLDGEGDCLVPTCSNCDTAWEIRHQGLKQIKWQLQPGNRYTSIYLPFWKIKTHLPALEIFSFTDFIRRTNQPIIPKPKWQDKMMSFWIPAFKLRPKIFLQVARGTTISQWRVNPEPGRVVPDLYPVNLPSSEARQAIKVTLAACTTSRKNVFPYLPETRVKNTEHSLVYLPFVDQGHDWVQPETGTVVAKSVLRFGRNL